MKMIISAILLTLMASIARADYPAAYDAFKWDALVNRAYFDGERFQATNGAMRTLTRQVGADLTKDHESHYFTVFGTNTADGGFRLDRAEAVSEIWVTNEAGDMVIDQWIYVLELGGKVRESMHRRLVRAPEGTFRSAETLRLTTEEAMAQWNTMFLAWTK